MKKIKFITMAVAVCLMALATGTVNAQGKAAFSGDKVAQKDTDRMATYLELNANQKKALMALNKERNEKRIQEGRAVRNARQKSDTKGSEDASRNANKKVTDDYEKSLKAILTPEQFQKWKAQDKPSPKRKND
ncbi:MAG: DUF4890 domain-containing protein [Sinomicrobium sp.]|nr:DUF4890 domain-containing protein [Sinomicrobium sp.]